ncbi:RagB/SusD family nutrient uptake outer membrane protein [Flammeovirga sp. EKP202]|uniref:RagB/SusD family nutrient uptake outer membrane protein n=1 Tax=Flammeovirga sp. EKP202 TaxID=2770592 RepID=UPI00165F372F|nr:RagB/SusD family nutrient uptake outer membrane protein [Flammeovirga sp. EKP202]MBD0402832.1 RagB/SusD family nutrient uptake outer membrane protein [Flammeovirga sp. EKP202]
MKRFIILLLAIGFLSCERFLDRSPDQGVTESEVFTNYESYRAFNDKLYAYLDDYFDWRRRFDSGSFSDETENNSNWTVQNDMNAGGFYSKPGNANNTEVGWEMSNQGIGSRSPVIANSFQAIRTANITIERIEMLEDATPQQIDELLGQAYFMRAWHYFQVLIRWGGMPEMKNSFTPDTDFNLPRRNFVESAQDCVEDLDMALELLPNRWEADQLGRVTKGAALGLKGMIQLYMASPLMQQDAGNGAVYNNELLQQAMTVQGELFRTAGEYGIQLMNGNNYSDIFYNEFEPANSEFVFWRHTGIRSSTDVRNHFIPQSYGGANATTGPTQNIVDRYEMSNGLPINDPDSGYDTNNPYENRDPRFYNNILYNGAPWGKNGNTQLYIETFTGGREDKLPINQRSLTGYFVKKYWPVGNNRWENRYGMHYMPWVFIRYAQIYLDFAEAANEVYGPTTVAPEAGMSAVQAINIIRNRVGMPDVNAKYTSSKDVFRERIRNERAVELCFEGHRWFDSRRWKTAEQDYRSIRKVIITKDGDNYTYEYPEIPNARNFAERNYWYPIPLEEVSKNENFTQNPGW